MDYLIAAAVVIWILLLAVIAFSTLGIALAALAREQRKRGECKQEAESWPDEIG